MNNVKIQKETCKKYKTIFSKADPKDKMGIALNVKKGVKPINGLRHQPENGTSGWYIWAGEKLSEDPEFFKPLHHEHVSDWEPSIVKFLALPPGWRFLINGDYEDVWFDESLLET